MKKLCAICVVLTFCGCGNNRSSLEAHQQTARIDNNVVAKYAPAESRTEEYVNRVGKRILMVSERPDSNYNFKVLETNDLVLTINQETHSVIISEGLLHQLNNEAELAAALAMGIIKLNQEPNVDKETLMVLSRAGYDPHAMLELQQQYFYAANNNQVHWMQGISPDAPTPGSITTNELMLQKMPQGLLSGEDDYNKELNG